MIRVLRLLLVVLLAVTACASPSPEPNPTGDGTAPPTTIADVEWPGPAHDRPVVDLSFTMADDLHSATGREVLRFVPDRRVCELVFRLWPNGPTTAEAGASLQVSSATVDGRAVTPTLEPGGAPSGEPGTILVARLPACVAAGTAVTADLTFQVRLPARSDGRLGYDSSSQIAWLGTAFPLLAWQNGHGWTKEPAVPVIGESTTSETFNLRTLRVTAPSRYDVAGVGRKTGSAPGAAPDTTVHSFTADALRDVTVTVGRIDLTTFEASGTKVTLALPKSGSRSDAAMWRQQVTDALARLAAMFGPVPYPEVWLSILPGVTEGVEYPGAVQFADVSPRREYWLIVHELAHQWFYGLVGNNQGLHPWLDEAFATYAQEVVDPTTLSSPDPGEWLGISDAVGASMAQWDERRRSTNSYVATVYRRGGRTLLEARQAAGPAAFDEAILGYLKANAHGIATPQDVAAALESLPEAQRILREAGAIP